MALNRATFENAQYNIQVIKMYGGGWYIQVVTAMEGGGTRHAETVEFGTYRESVDYIFEKYELVTE